MNREEAEIMQEIVESDHKPVYQKPKTSLFLINWTLDKVRSGGYVPAPVTVPLPDQFRHTL